MCNIISKARKFSKYVTLVRLVIMPNIFLTYKEAYLFTIAYSYNSLNDCKLSRPLEGTLSSITIKRLS